MAYDVLQREIIGLPDDKLMQLVDFARFLKQSMAGGDHAAGDLAQRAEESQRIVRRRIGAFKEDFVSIAQDFDDSLESLEEYI